MNQRRTISTPIFRRSFEAILVVLSVAGCTSVASALDSLDALVPTPHLLRSRADDLNIDAATLDRIDKLYNEAEPRYHELKSELKEHTHDLNTSLRKHLHFNNHFDKEAIAKWLRTLLEAENRLKLYQIAIRTRLLSQVTTEQRQAARNYASEQLQQVRWRNVIADGMLDTLLPSPFWLRSRAQELGIDAAKREKLEQTYQDMEPRYHKLSRQLEPFKNAFREAVLAEDLDEELIVKRFTVLLEAETQLKLYMLHVRGSLMSLLTADQRRAAQRLSQEKPKADWQKVLRDKVRQVRKLGGQLAALGESVADIEEQLANIEERISEGMVTEGGQQLSQLIDKIENRLKEVGQQEPQNGSE